MLRIQALRDNLSAQCNHFAYQSEEKNVLKRVKLLKIVENKLLKWAAMGAYHSDDAFFVFFTDGDLVFRPVGGLFNTAAGIGQSIWGFLSWPFDAGRNLQSGAKGILMSLPELLFFNMRKGSYKYLSYDRFVNDQAPKY